ncbi:RNA methyltransferase [Prochlorococcus sp. MIT 1341]|uniref:RNA methyltransferase n=1 Tax=Prochlorococcus sp. MIT 1341 TaxID=3096221 RepID=UPI002A7639A4|nr:RNA methyltransferase [Prochlorococcus sp. MIT 1341]
MNENIKIVLVEPAGEINVGSVARLCSNFGLNEIRFVSPRCNVVSTQAKRMALKGAALLEKSRSFYSLLDAVSDCTRVVATCARIDHGEIPLEGPSRALPWLLDGVDNGSVAIVFGREDRGLSNDELLLAQRVLKLEMNSEYPSLNLSHAVAIALYELQRFQFDFASHSEKSFKNILATPLQLGDCLEDAEKLLIDVGFLLEHTSKARMSKVRALLNRSEVRPEEVSLIRGMIRQLRWALNSSRS